jgi:hypothetical protein
MTPTPSTHLSEEALDDVLIGLGSPESEAHVVSCPECRAKLETFHFDMWLFNAASMAWSESKRSQTRRTAHVGAGSRTRIAFLSWAAATALLLVAAFATWRHLSLTPPNHANTVESKPVDYEAQIAQDNQLLQAVNAAIGPDEESPIVEYRILEKPQSHIKAHRQMRLK